MFQVSKTKEIDLPIKEKIIVALDVETVSEAREIIAELREEVGAFKIGLQLFSSAGASFVSEAVAENVKVFLDLKFHDIPNTVAKASVAVARLGVWMFNLHAVAGSDAMRRTVEEVSRFCEMEDLVKPKIIGVTVLTSSGSDTLRESGVVKQIDEQVLGLARLAANCNLDGVVASPREVRLIRENIDKKDFLLVTPGIRNSKIHTGQTKIINQLETIDDQKRVMSAREAVQTGSDYLVIGRPILQAKYKIKAVREIVRDIETS